MKKKTLTIVSSCAAIVVCSSLIVGSTYALFTSKDTVNIAVTAGKVAVTAEVVDSSLELTSMGEKQTVTNEDGTVTNATTWANGGTAGFTDKKNLNLTYITPGDGASFDIKVTNESTVNVQYRIKWSVEGKLADALEATATVAKIGVWTEWLATDEVKEKTISVTVSLPEEYEDVYGSEESVQGEEATISFWVEAVQGNAEVEDEITTVNGVGYETLEEALKAAQDGDTINFLRSENNAEVQTLIIDKNVSIVGNGEATLENVHFVLTDKAEVTFDKVNFEGDSYINVTGAGALNMAGCVANVDPAMFTHKVAFIAGTETQHGLKLNLVGNTINAANASDDSTSAAVYLWTWVDDSIIANNTFGSENDRYGFYAIKIMNAAQDAVITLEGNTVYGRDNNYAFNAFCFGQNTSRANTYTVISNDNTVYAVSEGAEYFKAFAIGFNASDKNHTLTFIDNGTTLNGKLISVDDIDIDFSDCYLYLNINGEERVANILTEVSEGLYSNENATEYYVANAAGVNAWHDLISGNKNIVYGKTFTILNDIDAEGCVWESLWLTPNSATAEGFVVDGGNHTISNLTITGGNNSGLFSGSLGAYTEVKNLTFDNVTVNSTGINVGVVFGQVYTNALIENVKVLNSTVTGNYKVAALVGVVYDESDSRAKTLTIKDCLVQNTTVKATVYDFATCGMVGWVNIADGESVIFENSVLDNCTLDYSQANPGYAYHYWGYYTAGETLGVNEQEGLTVKDNCKLVG